MVWDVALDKQPGRAEPAAAETAEPLTQAAVRAQLEKQVAQESEAVRRVLAAVNTAAQSFRAQQEQNLAQWQRLAVELAVVIVGRLTHDKIRSGDFAVEESVRKIVSQLASRQPVKVYLHPEDVALLERRLAGQPLFTDASQVQVAADPGLSRGNCRADAGEVTLLARLDAQLAELRQQTLRSLAHVANEPR